MPSSSWARIKTIKSVGVWRKNPGKESRGIGSGNAYNFKIKISLGACRIVLAPRKCNQGITWANSHVGLRFDGKITIDPCRWWVSLLRTQRPKNYRPTGMYIVHNMLRTHDVRRKLLISSKKGVEFFFNVGKRAFTWFKNWRINAHCKLKI